MAIFRKKTDEAVEANDEAVFEPKPEKASTWFDHARTAADSYNYEYALHCYASGIKLDPERMSAHEAMYDAGLKYHGQGGKPASSRDIKKISDTHPVAKFAAAEFAWMRDIDNASLAVKTLEAAVKAELLEYGNWIAQRVLFLLVKAKKPSKAAFVQAMELFRQVGAWNEAINAGERAMQLDPSDAKLGAELKDLAAQRAMDQGGYEEAGGREGGFREFVKDADKQRELIEDEALSQSASAEERVLSRARAEYEQDPDSPDALNKYGQLLRKSADPAQEEEAYRLYMDGFERMKEYRFRMAAGDIRIAQLRRAESTAKQAMEAAPEDAAAKAAYDDAHRARITRQAEEFSERIVKYPSNLQMRYELATILFELGNFNDAMEQFQKAKDEPKYKVRSGYGLGRCFAAEGWHPEAVGEYREALAAIEVTEKNLELQISYDLMVSLMEDAREKESIELAKEALEICSGIARKNISFRDIRVRRKELDTLIKELG